MPLRKYSVQYCHTLAQSKGGIFLSKEYKNTKTNYLWKCQNNHIWQAKLENILQGKWCAKCSGNAKKTLEDCQRLAINNDGYFLSTFYHNVDTKYLWECSLGHRWHATYASIKRGSWCPKCNKNSPKSINDCFLLATKKDGYFLSNEYANSRTKYLWQCHKGHIWEATFDAINSGKWCHECGGSKLLTIKHCQDLARSKGGKCLSNEYINSRTKYLWQCKENHIWKSSYNTVSTSWCPKCARNQKLSIKDCQKLALEKNGKCLSQQYINIDTKYLWECKDNHKWLANLSVIKKGHWCPVCCFKKQRLIYDICCQIFPNYKIYYNFKEFNWLKNKKGRKMELDIYIPKLKLAIEYDGEQHFMPVPFGRISIEKAVQNFEDQKIRDKIKENKIISNPQDIKYFIRFNYTEDITKEYVTKKICLHLGISFDTNCATT